MQASASYITGSQAIKVGFQDSWGPYNQYLRANADLYQNYTTSATTGLPVPSTVTLLASPPLTWQDRLNANLGIYGQDVLTFKRATITLGGRYEVHQRAGHRAGAQWPLREHPGVRRHQDADVEELLAAHLDRLRPDGQRQDRGPLRLQPVRRRGDDDARVALRSGRRREHHDRAPWTDKNSDDIAQGANRCNFADPTCEINFATCRPTSASSRWQPRSEPDASLRRSVQPRRDARNHARRVGGGEWFHNDAKNSWERNNILRPGTFANGTVSNPSYSR